MNRDQSTGEGRGTKAGSKISHARFSNFVTRQPFAFTLIELLVVIGIIGILAALVLAVTARAKNTASKVTDINNLRQIMIALHSYCADNGDTLPMANWDNGNATGDGQVHRGWLYLPNPSAPVGDTNRYQITTGALWDTLRDPRIYFCPMDKPGSLFDQRPQQISSYAMNGAVNGFMYFWEHPEMAYTRLGTMRPTDCAFWETDETDPSYFNDGANFPGEGVSGRHYQGGIQAAFDTSVSYVRLDQWYNDVADTNKNRLWCYPGTADGGDPENPGHQQ